MAGMNETTAKPAGADAALVIDGPAGRIEAAYDEAEATPQPVLAIVCHPLPTEGGTMHNKVVTMAARALRESGIATLRFNFRGVGGSEGAFDDGDGELDDLRAVAAWVRAHAIRTRRCGWPASASVPGCPCAGRWNWARPR